MEAIISLRFGDENRIIKQIAVCGIPTRVEPFYEPSEVNIHLEGRDASVRSFFYFLAHNLKEGTVVDWKLARDPDVPK